MRRWIRAGALVAVLASGGSAGAAERASVLGDVRPDPTGSNGTCQLTIEVPAGISKGKAVTLLLHVRKDGVFVDDVAACLAVAPLFLDAEDILDPTPAGGADLGTGIGSVAQPACTMGIAGEPRGSGAYVFAWEPDTPGRVNLTFTVRGGTLRVPVDVASAPPSLTVLTLFVLIVVTILGSAAYLRRRQMLEGAAP
jgi:hypothetical protein